MFFYLKNTKYLVFVLLCFVLCYGSGIFLSLSKPLWKDELYTQVRSVENTRVLDIVRGEINEGNNCPLFYITQKCVASVFEIKLAGRWDDSWTMEDKKSQLVLRLFPNIFMSATIALIAVYFLWRCSWFAGIYAFMTALSSYMVWPYWVEARPYALWVFLTACQSLIFLEMLRQEKPSQNLWDSCIAVHALLSLTIVFSLVQIAGVSLLLWLFKERRWRRYVFLTLIPAGLCLFYYARAPHYQFWFADSPLDLIAASFPKERLLLMFVYGILLGVSFWRRKFLGNRTQVMIPVSNKVYFSFALMMVMAAAGLLTLLKINSTGGSAGFQISNRYFIFLMPVGVISIMLFMLDLYKNFSKFSVLKYLIIIFFSLLLIFRAHRTFLLAQGLY